MNTYIGRYYEVVFRPEEEKALINFYSECLPVHLYNGNMAATYQTRDLVGRINERTIGSEQRPFVTYHKVLRNLIDL